MSKRSRRARAQQEKSGARPAPGSGSTPPTSPGSGQRSQSPAPSGGSAAGSGGAAQAATGARRGERVSRGPSGTRRAGRRDRPVRRYDDRSVFERFRTPLLAGFIAIGVVAIFYVFFASAASRAYSCASELTPPPGSASSPAPGSPSPAGQTQSPAAGSPTAAPTSPAATGSPGASPTASPSPGDRLGFVTRDLGRLHVRTGPNRYEYCPPASGPHYNESGRGPLRRNFYGPGEERDPAGWLHNLEHGYVVALYSCGRDGTQCPSDSELEPLRRFYETAPQTEGATRCRLPNKVLVARFDLMSTRFALLAWDRALLTNTFDVEQARRFAQQWIDSSQAPEPGAC